jgi:hypothetical protein
MDFLTVLSGFLTVVLFCLLLIILFKPPWFRNL